MKKWVIFCFVFGITTSHAQDYRTYYESCNQADHLIHLKKYDAALDTLKYAFTTVPYTHAYRYLKASQCALEVSHFEEAYHFAKKALLNGMQSDFWKHKEFKPLQKTSYYQMLEDSASIFRERHEQSINLEYKKIIDSLVYVDQRIVRNYPFAKGNYDIEVLNFPRDQKSLDSLDSLIAHHLLELIDRYGFPSEEVIGPESHQNASRTIIHHNFRHAQYEQYHLMLIDAIYKGEYQPQDFAHLYDQYYNWYKGKSFFTFTDRNLTPQNMEWIEKNRQEFCLKPLSAFKLKKRSLRMKPIW